MPRCRWRWKLFVGTLVAILLATAVFFVWACRPVGNVIKFPFTLLPDGGEQGEVTLTVQVVGDTEYSDGSSIRTFDTGSESIFFQFLAGPTSLKGALRTKMMTQVRYDGELKEGMDLLLMYWYTALSRFFVASVYVDGSKVGECRLLADPWIQAPDGSRWQAAYGRAGDDVIWFSGQSVAGLGYRLPSGSVAYAYWYIRWDPSDRTEPYVDLSQYRGKSSLTVRIETVEKWAMWYFKPSLVMKANLGERSKTMVDVRTLSEFGQTITYTSDHQTITTWIPTVTETVINTVIVRVTSPICFPGKNHGLCRPAPSPGGR